MRFRMGYGQGRMEACENEYPRDDVQLFLAIAETGSLSAAAKRLQVGQPTVSRCLAQLEYLLGDTLFRRQAGCGPPGLPPCLTVRSPRLTTRRRSTLRRGSGQASTRDTPRLTSLPEPHRPSPTSSPEP